MDGEDLGRLVRLGLLLMVLGGWVLVEFRGRAGLALRRLAAWGLIFLGVMAGWGLWQDIRGDLAPQMAVVGAGRIEVPRGPDGHYTVTARVNGVPVRFLIDTGATDLVLSARDAARAGIDPADLAYTGRAVTANGTVATARVRLEDLTLGPWTDRRLPAQVTAGDLDSSLMGVSYLDRYRIGIEGGVLWLERGGAG